MMHQNIDSKFFLGIGILIIQLSATFAFSCGVEWKKPKTHFDGVNEYGFVSYWNQVGELTMGKEKFPLIIGFRSDWQRTSPYLGQGWLLGILDSYIVQTGSDAFDMIEPDGYTVPFGRSEKNPTVLLGAKGWTAEIKGDQIVAVASCGWKLAFRKGKIEAIFTPEGSEIQIQRDAEGIATGVVEGSTVLLKVDHDIKRGSTTLTFEGKTIAISCGQRPIMQSIGGVSVVRATVSAVSSIRESSGKTTSYDYTPYDNVKSALRIDQTGASSRTISWNPNTGIIESDNEWIYQVKPSENIGGNAAITRSTPDGTKEYWFKDGQKGEEVTLWKNGDFSKRVWFTSGLLKGKIRKIELVTAGKGTTENFVYDEKGRILRKLRSNGETLTFNYLGDSSSDYRMTLSNKAGQVFIYDYKNDMLASRLLPNNVSQAYFYNAEKKLLNTTLSNIPTITSETNQK